LFLAFFAILAVGVLIGGIAVWVSHHKVRRALNRSKIEANRLRQEVEKLTAERIAATPGTALPAIAGPRRVA
jgi:hypothetical protein